MEKAYDNKIRNNKFIKETYTKGCQISFKNSLKLFNKVYGLF